MLNIYIEDKTGTPKEYESYVSDYFDFSFFPEWFSDEFVQKIIREIDKSEVQVVPNINSTNILSPVLGNIAPERLSSGCKALILIHICDLKVNGDRLGDNCVPLLLELAGRKDVYISLSHIMKFPDEFDAVIINNGKHITSYKEFVSIFVEVS